MKVVKQAKRYCPYCKKHTMHNIKQQKVKARPKTRKHGLKWGVRHQAKIESGYGSFPKPKAAKSEKTSKHPTFIFTCSVCKKSHVKVYSRAKKVSQV